MNNSYKIFLLAILLASFTLRINRLDYPLSGVFAWGDGTRDYFVASHIIRYHEFPKMGPYNLLDATGIKNSPIYFYILALPLLFYNHPLTLGLVNISLQISVLVLIFLIAKQTFGNRTALIALILFGFNPEIIKQADYIWQPYLMMPFALLSLYLFIRAYFKKNSKFIFLSVIVAILAFAIHNSAFPWLVILLIGSFVIGYKERKSFKYYLGIIISFVLVLIILYMPVLLSSSGFKNLPAQSFENYLNNLNFNLETFLNVFYVNKLFLAALLIFFVLRSHQGLGATLLLILFLSPILFASLFHKIRFHYLMLSAPMFAILVAYFLERIKFVIPKLALLALLVWVFSGHFQFLRDFKRPLENLKVMDQISEKIVSELPNPQTFQVKSYAKDNTTFYYPVLDTILLVPLEEKLKVKLAEVSDESPYNHVQINEKDYIVLACYKFHNQDSDCREDFLKDNEDYEIKKIIRTSEFISVYSAKQKAY